MIPTEYLPIVNALIDKTKEMKLKWERTSSETKFQTAIGENTVVVYYYYTYPDDIPCIGIDILDLFGEKIDQFSSEATDADFSILDDLYTRARRNALHIDATISTLKSNLDKL
ncbi:MAG: hypothetical protein K2K00_03355 [Muribaculaceae bacterium]|nr:hypothetical protein [Muribaculaceae bacterium]